jgi:hypothetical protein
MCKERCIINLNLQQELAMGNRSVGKFRGNYRLPYYKLKENL